MGRIIIVEDNLTFPDMYADCWKAKASRQLAHPPVTGHASYSQKYVRTTSCLPTCA